LDGPIMGALPPVMQGRTWHQPVPGTRPMSTPVPTG